jgi:hypothetical protein
LAVTLRSLLPGLVSSWTLICCSDTEVCSQPASDWSHGSLLWSLAICWANIHCLLTVSSHMYDVCFMMGSMSFHTILLLQLSFMYFSKHVCILHKKKLELATAIKLKK